MDYYTYNESSGPSTLLFFFENYLAILGPLNFHVNFKMGLSVSAKIKPAGIFIGIMLNLSIILGRVGILTILYLLILLFSYSLISLSNVF